MKKRRPIFEPGERVRVRLWEEISPLLDELSKTDGCLFMSGMEEFCGKEFTILKPVNTIYDEYRKEMTQTRSPLYVLDRSLCKGNVQAFEQRCDRTCYFLWHEAWLEKRP